MHHFLWCCSSLFGAVQTSFSTPRSICPQLAAVSSARAIEKVVGVKPQIKWVNDIYLDGKKVGGILTQAHLSKDCRDVLWAVVGIGINISEPEGGFPDELRSIAASLGKNDGSIKNRLIGEIVNEFVSNFLKNNT